MTRALVTLALLAALAPATALAAGKLKVAVPDLKLQNGVPPELAEPLALALAQELEKVGPFKAISMRELREMMEFDKSRALLGCDTEKCLAEIGGALGVDLIASGRVSRLGDTFVIQLQLINIKQAKVVGRASREHRGDAQGLLAEIRVAALVLVRDLLESLAGELAVTASEEGASVKVDGQIVGVTPLPAPLKVTAGPHTIDVEREGFIVFKRDVSIVPRELTEVTARLQPSKEFLEAYDAQVSSSRLLAYSLTGAGALAVGGAVVAYLVGAGKADDLSKDARTYNAQALRTTGEFQDLQAREREIGTFDAVTLISGGVGLACLGAGAFVFATGPAPDRYTRTNATSPSAAPAPTALRLVPHRDGLALRVGF